MRGSTVLMLLEYCRNSATLILLNALIETKAERMTEVAFGHL